MPNKKKANKKAVNKPLDLKKQTPVKKAAPAASKRRGNIPTMTDEQKQDDQKQDDEPAPSQMEHPPIEEKPPDQPEEKPIPPTPQVMVEVSRYSYLRGAETIDEVKARLDPKHQEPMKESQNRATVRKRVDDLLTWKRQGHRLTTGQGMLIDYWFGDCQKGRERDELSVELLKAAESVGANLQWRR